MGKTALIQKYVYGQEGKECNATVGVDFSSKTLDIDGRYVQLQMWDTVMIKLGSLVRTYTDR